MNYKVVVDWAPAYELVCSLDAYLSNLTKTMDLGTTWEEGVRARLHGPLAELRKWPNCDDPFVLIMLIWQSPEPRSAERFLEWLGKLTPGEAYELILPYLPSGSGELLRNLPAALSNYVTLLTDWHEQYFRGVEESVLQRLAAEAAARTARVASQPPVDAVEEATVGVVVETVEIDRVLLIPQYHYAPINIYTKCGPVLVMAYALEPVAEEPGMPPSRMVRVARALGDENRLRVLHFLADGQPHSFTEVQKATGLAKNSVHYHLMALRAAGLTRVHLITDCGNERYTARRATIDQFGPRLQEYLDER